MIQIPRCMFLGERLISWVPGIREFTVSSADEVMSLLHRGNKNRTTEPTKANETSSRSHAVCQVFLERKEKTGNVHAKIRVSKLSLIDLAGSERATVTEVTISIPSLSVYLCTALHIYEFCTLRVSDCVATTSYRLDGTL